MDNVSPDATVYTDEATLYRNLPFEHEAVNNSVGEYVRYMASVNGMESFWAALKRAHKGVFHKISPKHLDRYVREFAGKHNLREEGHHRSNAPRSGRVNRTAAHVPATDRAEWTGLGCEGVTSMDNISEWLAWGIAAIPRFLRLGALFVLISTIG